MSNTVRLTLAGIDSDLLTVDVPEDAMVLSEGQFEDPLKVKYVTTVKVPFVYTFHTHEYSHPSVPLIGASTRLYRVCSAQVVDDSDEYTIDPALRTTDSSFVDGCEVCVLCKGVNLSYVRVTATDNHD